MAARIVVAGAAGRMGQQILAQIAETDGAEAVGAVDRQAGQTGEIEIVTDLASALENADAVIDFTAPEATARHAGIAAEAGVAFVTGTTGLEGAPMDAVRKAAESVAVVQAPNMSLGVNVLLAVVEQLAARLPGYDIEIVEAHHRRKVDAPSGTALRLAEAAAQGRGWDLGSVAVYGREGHVGARPDEQIGVMTLRGGDIVGDHTVMLAGPGERVEVTHRAHSRSTFAAGAVRAAMWAADQDPGLYDMRAVLGIE